MLEFFWIQRLSEPLTNDIHAFPILDFESQSACEAYWRKSFVPPQKQTMISTLARNSNLPHQPLQ
jgi:hypothetical protein